MSSISAILPLERTRWFRDRDGNLATSKRYDEIVRLTLDYTDQLAMSETVSSVATEARGVTLSSASTSSPTYAVSVTGTGSVEVTATLSTGRKLQHIVCFYGIDGGSSDYGG